MKEKEDLKKIKFLKNEGEIIPYLKFLVLYRLFFSLAVTIRIFPQLFAQGTE